MFFPLNLILDGNSRQRKGILQQRIWLSTL
jgi:hypothetical protein